MTHEYISGRLFGTIFLENTYYRTRRMRSLLSLDTRSQVTLSLGKHYGDKERL
jgi:hypothetical protein